MRSLRCCSTRRILSPSCSRSCSRSSATRASSRGSFRMMVALLCLARHAALAPTSPPLGVVAEVHICVVAQRATRGNVLQPYDHDPWKGSQYFQRFGEAMIAQWRQAFPGWTIGGTGVPDTELKTYSVFPVLID